jgi:hypothetical protein
MGRRVRACVPCDSCQFTIDSRTPPPIRLLPLPSKLSLWLRVMNKLSRSVIWPISPKFARYIYLFMHTRNNEQKKQYKGTRFRA